MQLDGKPIKIEMVGTNIVTPAVMPPVTNGILGNPYGVLGRYPLVWPLFFEIASSRLDGTEIHSLKVTTV